MRRLEADCQIIELLAGRLVEGFIEDCGYDWMDDFLEHHETDPGWDVAPGYRIAREELCRTDRQAAHYNYDAVDRIEAMLRNDPRYSHTIKAAAWCSLDGTGSTMTVW